MKRPDPARCAAVLFLAGAVILPASAQTVRTEYRYPDRPDVVFTDSGEVLRTDANRPLAFSSFEAAISAGDAQSVVNSQPGYSPMPLPRPAPAPVQQSRTVASVAPSQAAFAVQAGAFSSKANADRLASELSRFGAVNIEPSLKNGKTLYRVQVGGFSNKTEASSLARNMKASGYDGFAVALS